MVWPCRRWKLWLTIIIARDQARRQSGIPITALPTYGDEP